MSPSHCFILVCKTLPMHYCGFEKSNSVVFSPDDTFMKESTVKRQHQPGLKKLFNTGMLSWDQIVAAPHD